MDASSKKVILAAFAGNSLIAVTKFAAAFLTNSSAMLSEGIHSLVDTGNQILLLYGLHRSKKPPDENFSFGYSKEIYFWSFVVAILIFAVGAGVSLYEGVHHLIHPVSISNPKINYIVLGIAGLFEGAAWIFAWKEFSKVKKRGGYIKAIQEGKDPSLFVVLFEDSAALLGLFVAFLGVFCGQITGNMYFDGMASVVIGLILGGTALWLAIETKGLLIGESADPVIVKGIRKLADDILEIEQVHDVLTMHLGPRDILLNMSVDFSDEILANEVEDAISRLDRMIKQRFPEIKRVFIEAEDRGGDASNDNNRV